MLTRPNRQSLTAFWGRIAALGEGGGKLCVRSNHCRSETISKLRSVFCRCVRASAPQSITLALGAGELDAVEEEYAGIAGAWEFGICGAR